MNHYLLEIGMEEIPARFLQSLSQQLKDRLAAYLEAERIAFDGVEAFATPRRLAVRVRGLADQQQALEEEVRGPSLKVAKDQAGQWSKAALGFLRGQQAQVEDLFIKEVKGVDYVFVNKVAACLSVESVLAGISTVVAHMNFPVTMRWADLGIEYIRPVHWIVSLLNDQVIPFEFAGIQADRYTRGHRFLAGQQAVELSHALDYEESLMDAFVIADFDRRQAVIQDQINRLAQEKNWVVPENQDLLDEVTAIVEWPTAFSGQFEEQYLELPDQVLVTAMRDHQRYFYVMDSQGEHLLPYFISVRNGHQAHMDNVIKGNQKVLRARLADAEFFYQEDLKHTLTDFVDRLGSLNEHYQLGTFADKQDRVGTLVDALSHSLSLDSQVKEDALRASQIYKFDLVTLMVDEFSELQGVVGGIYAQHYGENHAVAQAISEQYLPTAAGGDLPQSPVGALLAVADKLDTLMAYFNVGIIPTGSNDPYALRRQAMGVVEILMAQDWQIDLLPVLEDRMADQDARAALVDFIKARVQVYMDHQAIDYDLIQAVLGQPGLIPWRMVQAGRQIAQKRFEDQPSFNLMIENLSRVVNLGNKVEETVALELDLAQSDLERDLILKVQSLKAGESLAEEIQVFYEISPMIAAYFQDHMVNAEDRGLRFNRYQLMADLTAAILRVFDPRQVVNK
ncbi:glycine--tRNA ligase subunit beta [Facklamia languida]